MRNSFATCAGYMGLIDRSSIIRHATGFASTRIWATSRNIFIFFADTWPSDSVTSDFLTNGGYSTENYIILYSGITQYTILNRILRRNNYNILDRGQDTYSQV